MSQDRYEAQDQERRTTANELGDGFTRVANALAHVDRRRTNLAGGHEGDDMDPLQRMRFSQNGHPRAARYDGDSESAPAREPRCTCGHNYADHHFAEHVIDCTNDPTRYTLPSPFECPANRDVRCDGCKGNLTRIVKGPESTCHRDCRCLHYEPDSVRGLNSDPTGTAALIPDKANADLKRLDKLQRAARINLDEQLAILAKYGQARPASDADRAQLEKANIRPEPGCTNCGKYGHWQPVDPRVPKRAVCGWCLSWERDTGDLPGKRECDLHADDKNVRRPDKNHISRRKSA